MAFGGRDILKNAQGLFLRNSISGTKSFCLQNVKWKSRNHILYVKYKKYTSVFTEPGIALSKLDVAQNPAKPNSPGQPPHYHSWLTLLWGQPELTPGSGPEIMLGCALETMPRLNQHLLHTRQGFLSSIISPALQCFRMNRRNKFG